MSKSAFHFSRTVVHAVIGVLLFSTIGVAQNISLLGGIGTPGCSGDGGPAASAAFGGTFGFCIDATGDAYVADWGCSTIRRIDHATGVITKVVGTGTAGFSGDGGQALSAQLNFPSSLCFDAAGNMIITDEFNHRIRKVDAVTGVITTIAGTGTWGYAGDGGPAVNAQLHSPTGVFADASGNIIFSDKENYVIRKITVSTGIITTIAGTGVQGYTGDGGPATSAQLSFAVSLCHDAAGNIFIAERDLHVLRKITIATGVITTVAGTGTAGFSGDNGPASAAALNYPWNICADAAGNIYIADRQNMRIRKIAAATGIISTVAGNGIYGSAGDGGPATSAALASPGYVGTNSTGTRLLIGEIASCNIREVQFPVGVAENADELSVTLYPNPSNDIFTLELSGTNVLANVIVRNLTGQIVYETIVLPGEKKRIDLTGAGKGVYLLSIGREQAVLQKKLVVE